MTQLFANAARSALAADISAADTALMLTPGTGAVFPAVTGSDWFYLTLQDDAGVEIVQVTAHDAEADALTVVRGQQDTQARDFAAGAVVGLRLTSADARGWAALSNGLITKTLNMSGTKYAITSADAGTLFFTAGFPTAFTLPASSGVPVGTIYGFYNNNATLTSTVTAPSASIQKGYSSPTTAVTLGVGTQMVLVAIGAYWLMLASSPTVAGCAPLASPKLTGTPTAPTPTAGDNSTALATTEFVQAAIAAALGGTA